MRSFFILIVCLLLLIAPTSAQSDTTLPPVDLAVYPSYASLQATPIPPADRVDIARRLLGIPASASQSAQPPLRTVGDQATFFITRLEGGGSARIQTILRGIGEHVYLWVDPTLNPSDDTINALVGRFDTDVYEPVRNLWGSEPQPGVDGEERLHMVITGRLARNVAGYFSTANVYPVSVIPTSNERDMMVFNSLVLSQNTQTDSMRIAAHEFQHLIQYGYDLNEHSWLNEGLSSVTEHLLGYTGSNFVLDSFMAAPDTPLTAWGITPDINADYGASMAFMIYLHDRFGLSLLQGIARDPLNGLSSVDAGLFAANAPVADVVVADWVLANLLQVTGTIYGYAAFPASQSVALTASVSTLPASYTRSLSQYGTHYYEYTNLPAGERSITLTMPDSVALLPTDAPSGTHVWYSQRGDKSNAQLTHDFDLRSVQTAHLDFRLWYDLETDWDYAYITVSSDGGATWDLLTTPDMRSTDPNGRAYGTGYTGQSNGWLDQSLSLDAYAGEQISIRFEMITDDAIHGAGLALDDIRLDAIGYDSDFETDDGGWSANGWIRTDNRLPQRAWLQIVAFHDSAYTITRYLATETSTWAYTPPPNTDRLVIAITPFAPQTTIPLDYTLQVE